MRRDPYEIEELKMNNPRLLNYKLIFFVQWSSSRISKKKTPKYQVPQNTFLTNENQSVHCINQILKYDSFWQESKEDE